MGRTQPEEVAGTALVPSWPDAGPVPPSQAEREEARRIAEEQFTLAFEQAAIGMLMAGVDRVITRVNPAVCTMLGRTAEEVVGHTPDDFTCREDLEKGQAPLVPRLLASSDGRLDAERRFERPDGTLVVTRCHLTLVRDSAGRPKYVFAQVEDITARKRQEEEIRRLALEDPLTGLPNRQLLYDRIDQALRRAQRSGQKVAIVLLDIDYFKRVNDSLGPAAGDRVLVEVATRLAGQMRLQDTVARLSGDEFVVLCEGVVDVEHARRLTAKVDALFERPFVIDEVEMFLTASCGITLAGAPAPARDLLRDAEAAMYLAKRRGPSRSAVFDESITRRATGRLDLEAALRRALEARTLGVAFQPVVQLSDERVVGFEALARWHHPERGLISPTEFIPLAEDTGLISTLGEFVLDIALDRLAEWRRDVPGWESLYVAVNLSPIQLAASDLLEHCLAALERHALPTSALRLEVTESALMEDPEFSTAVLERLSAEGIAIAMDDFGTGYSSLSRLKQLPVSTLKIDRSFIDGLGSDASDSSIVRAIVGLGHALGLELCAEGVELPVQRDQLLALECHQAQGYLWAPPLTPEEIDVRFDLWAPTMRPPETGPRPASGAGAEARVEKAAG
jgi:diguanylate cyclase (GGDEF)-like protein/PAS domain S-box-containing protein